VCASITLSVNSPAGQTPQRIFTVDSLKVSNNVLIKVTLSRQRHCRGKDADLHKNVLFGVSMMNITFFAVQSPPKPSSWGISIQICEKFK